MLSSKRPKVFYGLELDSFTWVHFYKFYLNGSYLSAARVAGLICDEEARERMIAAFGLLGLALGSYFQTLLERRAAEEAACDALDPLGEELLRRDERNFRLEAGRVESATVTGGRSLRAALGLIPSAGTLELRVLDGPVRRFTLLEREDVPALISALNGAGFRVEPL